MGNFVNGIHIGERVMIGPDLGKDDMEIVIEQAKRAGLGDRICKSSLLGEPRQLIAEVRSENMRSTLTARLQMGPRSIEFR